MKLTANARTAIDIVAILIMIGTVIVFAHYVRDDGVKCMQNPFKFGAKWMAENKDQQISCICQITGEKGDIIFNSSFYGKKITNNQIEPIEINLSLLE